MGLCQSIALKVTVYETENKKHIHYFSMKTMKAFHTIGDILPLVNVYLTPQDKVYSRSHIGLDEIPVHTQFQIRDLIVKGDQKTFKYRIVMEPMY